MSKAMQLILSILLVFMVFGCGGGGGEEKSSNAPSTTKPDVVKKVYEPTIVSIDSSKIDTITIFWLASADNSMKYEVHISEKKNFIPNSTTLIKTLIGANELDIHNLTPNTLYYVKIIAIDTQGKNFIGNELSATTASANATLSVKSANVKLEQNIGATGTDIKTDSIIFSGDKNISSGDVLIGTQNNPYLRKVTNVKKVGGKTEVETKDLSIAEVVSDGKITSKVVLFQNPTNSIARGSNNKKNVKTTWKSGRFSIDDSVKPSSRSIKKSYTIQNGKWSPEYEVSVAGANEEGWANVQAGETLDLSVTALMLAKGKKKKVTFRDIKLKSFKKGNEIISGLNPTSSKLCSLKDCLYHATNKKFKWATTKNDISRKYVATFTVEAYIDGKALDFDFDIKIAVLGDGKIDDSIKTDHKDNKDHRDSNGIFKTDITKSFENNIIFDFEPTLTIEHSIEDAKLKKALIKATGKIHFNVSSLLKYEALVSMREDYQYTFFERHYRNVYAVGPLPVYQEIEFKISAVIKKEDVEASGELEATSVFDTNFEASLGMEYIDGKWSKIPLDPKLTKTYTFTVAAKGGAKFKISLVPNIEISFYKAASAGLSVEPYAKGEVEAEATAIYQTNLEANENRALNQDLLGLFRLRKLDAEVGIEAKVYADLSIWKWNIAHYPPDSSKHKSDVVSSVDKGLKKILYNNSHSFFSMPTIAMSYNETQNICKPFNMKAIVKNGVNNPVDIDKVKWRIFPDYGAKVSNLNKSGGSITDYTLNSTIAFSKGGKYDVYLIANSKKLGDKFGKIYEKMTIDASECDYSQKECGKNEKLEDGKCIPIDIQDPDPEPTPTDKIPGLIIHTSSNKVYSDNFYLKVSAMDDKGLDRVEWRIYTESGISVGSANKVSASGTYSIKNFYVDIKSLLDGSYKIMLIAVDDKGQKSGTLYYYFTKKTEATPTPTPPAVTDPTITSTYDVNPSSATKGSNFAFRVRLSKQLPSGYKVYAKFGSNSGWLSDWENGGKTAMNCVSTNCTLNTAISEVGSRKVKFFITKNGNMAGSYSPVKYFTVTDSYTPPTITDPTITNISAITPSNGNVGDNFSFNVSLSKSLPSGYRVYAKFGTNGTWLTDTDPGGKVELSCSGTTCSFNDRITGKGNRMVKAFITKNGNMVGNYSQTRNFIVSDSAVDTDNKPTITINTQNHKTYSSNFSISVTARDDKGLKLLISAVLKRNGSDIISGTDKRISVSGIVVSRDFPIDVSSLAPGDYRVLVGAVDSSNQHTGKYYYFTRQ